MLKLPDGTIKVLVEGVKRAKIEAFSVSKQEHESLQKRIERRIKQGLSSGSDLLLVSSRLLQVSATASCPKCLIEPQLNNFIISKITPVCS
jgi:ATP-dependent Lon protease